MKSVDFLKVLGLAACLTIAGGAYAQNNDAATTTGSTEATPAAPAKHHHHMRETKAQRTANRKLAVAVRRALQKGGVDPTSIVVRVRDGNVTLLGAVSDPTSVDKANQIAQGVDGVKSVSNKLTYHQQ